MDFIDIQSRARRRRAHSDFGIGAAAVDATEPDRDGQRFRVLVTDTIRDPDWIDVIVPGHLRTTPEHVEAAVERRAGWYPLETRQRDLVSAGPISLSHLQAA